MSMTICARKRSFSESIIRNKSSWHTCLKWALLLTIPFIYHITLFKGRKSTTPSRVRIFTRARVFHSFLHPWRKCRLTGILVKTIYCFRPKGLRKLICFGDAYAYVALISEYPPGFESIRRVRCFLCSRIYHFLIPWCPHWNLSPYACALPLSNDS